jgi:hypothetical protein
MPVVSGASRRVTWVGAATTPKSITVNVNNARAQLAHAIGLMNMTSFMLDGFHFLFSGCAVTYNGLD